MLKITERAQRFFVSARHNLQLSKKTFAFWYGLGAITVLGATTALWSILSARIQMANADQLVNPYLFENHATFQQALFPTAHTFLLKWPLFLLIKILGFSDNAFIFVTVAVSLLTVGLFAYILYRIDSRTLIWATLFLAMSSMLLLVPTAAAPGSFLPVNLAMVTTRNIEYVWFIGSLYFINRYRRITHPACLLACFALALLIASDKLFIPLTVGAAAIVGVAFLLIRPRELARPRLMVLFALGAAMLTGVVLTVVLTSLNITAISSAQGTSPYKLVMTIGQLFTGIAFVVSSALTNFGANAVFDVATKSDFTRLIGHRLLTSSGIIYAINAGMALLGLLMTMRVTFSWLKHRASTNDRALDLSVHLFFASLAAIFVYVVTDHYYAADARYVAILFFAVFVGAATYLRSERPSQRSVTIIAAILMCCVSVGAVHAVQSYSNDLAGQAKFADRNAAVASVIASHPVGTVVGDYWRVLPIKHQSINKQTVTPLQGCTELRQTLSSKAWQPKLEDTSFAYLLSLDKGQTDFPSCKVEDVTKEYGKPNATVTIAGKVEKPSEVLLFYDRGANKSAPQGTVDEQGASTVTPTPSKLLPVASCPSGKETVLNVVAHQDDDLLFLSPDLLHDIHDQKCVRTVYVTAGDAGADKLYWLNREKGSQAAYAKMLHDEQNTWEDRTIKLGENRFATATNPRGNASISLIYLRLPDGNLHGEGFRSSKYSSLSLLRQGQIPDIQSVDGQSTYSADELETALLDLIKLYEPDVIKTQAPRNANDIFPDHSDHKSVGLLTKSVVSKLPVQSRPDLAFYIGYPIRGNDENISGQDLEDKNEAFLAYAAYDPSVCHGRDECSATPTYGSYLKRQFRMPR